MKACAAITGEIFTHHDIRAHDESSIRLRNAQSGIPSHIPIVEPVKISIKDVERVHRPQHLRWLQEMSRGTAFIDGNTYITSLSFDVALYAAGSAIAAVEQSIDGKHCFAIVRPPGHHAEADRAMGFCLLNNAAIAAAKALTMVDRVAIIDWDLHHGNGTQQIFYSTNRVLYCSLHQYNAFPFTGWVDEIGSGEGKGYNLNAPLFPYGALGDYLHVFQQVIIPALERFRPEVIIVSAGQDGLSDDPHGMMSLMPNDYHIFAGLIVEAADIPIALVLEGGYGPSLGKAISSIFTGLQEGPGAIMADGPRESTQNLVKILNRVRFL